MRTFERTRDVLDHARAFHHQVSDLYQRLEDRVEKERVQMLLDYLRRHEKHLEQSLADYEEEASKRILETWFQYTLEEDPSELLSELEVKGDMPVDDVVRLALRLDDYLIALYRNMADHTDIPDVKEVFTNLLELEQEDEHQIARNALRLDEM
jgi:rubrerythrin